MHVCMCHLHGALHGHASSPLCAPTLHPSPHVLALVPSPLITNSALTCIYAGKMEKPPKKAGLVQQYAEEKEITKMINANNESTFASKAQNAGGRLKAVSGCFTFYWAEGAQTWPSGACLP